MSRNAGDGAARQEKKVRPKWYFLDVLKCRCTVVDVQFVGVLEEVTEAVFCNFF